jgi:dTMP kinase
VSRARGLFVTFEGGEGSGKSTQVGLLAEWLARRGVEVVTSRDPGGTPVAEAIRELLLDPVSAPMAATTELLLYVAARAQLVREVIEPAVESGKVVLLDRYDDSTFAYQGAGRGIGADDVRRVNELATRGLKPDLTVLIDLGAEEGRRRRRADSARPAEDRMEGEEPRFHERVRDAFRRRAAAEPERFLVVDGRQSATTIQAEVRRRVQALLGPEDPQGLP